MLCAHCGMTSVDGLEACPHCSARFSAPLAAPARTLAPVPYGAWGSVYVSAPTPSRIHRLPLVGLLALLGLVVVVAGGIIAAIGIMAGSKSGPATATLPGIRGPAPVAVRTTIPTLLPTTPAQPTAVPSVQPSGAPRAGNGTISSGNGAVSLAPPAGWQVTPSQTGMKAVSPNGSVAVFVIAAPVSAPVTPSSVITSLTQQWQNQEPDTHACGNQTPATTPNGAAGTAFTLCMTLTNAGSSLPVQDQGIAAVTAGGKGIEVVEVVVAASDTGAAQQADPVLATLAWHLDG